MQHFGSQDWQAVRIREWLLLLRFAITHNAKDEASAPWERTAGQDSQRSRTAAPPRPGCAGAI